MIFIKHSVRDAEKAAKAAADNAEAVVENQRPFVGPLTISTDNIPLATGTEYRKFFVAIENSGHTPAQRMKVLFKGEIRPADWIPRFTPDPRQEPSKTLFPRVKDFYYPFAKGPNLTQEQVDRIKTGDNQMWIIGRIEYLDNRGRRQYTDVCTVWDRDREVFVPYREHNDAS